MINILTRNRMAEPHRRLMLALAAVVALVSGRVLAAEVADAPVFKEKNDRATNPRPASPEQMQWFRDAKFGLFIHWGPASLSGAEISWGRKDRIEGGGQELQQVPADVYDNLYKQFNPVKFDADQWMALAKDAGCRYVVFVTKHHDGFSMWPTEQVRWNVPARPKHYSIADTPFRRDLCQEIADAARKHGLKLGWYYSTRDWTHPDYLKGDNHIYNAYYEAQVRELLTRYGTVDIMWFDHAFGDWSQFTIEHLFKTMYQAQPNLLVNNRSSRGLQHIPAGAMQQLTEADYDTPEQQIGHFQTNRVWESCVTMTKCRNDTGGWSYRPGEPTRSYEECTKMLVSTVTGDGNLLLNVGPLPTGEILPEQVEVLKKMGGWLKKHGQSIYGTRGGPFTNGGWGGSTQRGNKIWLHVFDWSGGDTLRLPPLQDTIQSVLTLDGAKPKTVQAGSGLEITLPKAQQDPVDTVIELTLERH
jgi:alpha-L-fucosidase